MAEEDGRQTAEGAENRVNKNKRQETVQVDEINKNRHNKEQRAKYGTADITRPVKESGGKDCKRPL